MLDFMSSEIIRCFCIWSDLLGFGQAFEDGNWSFQTEHAAKNIARLRLLENSLHRSNDPVNEVSLVLNDALARVYDFPQPYDETNAFVWWLHSAISNHWYVNTVDLQRGNPGIRSVLTVGERVKTWRQNMTVGEQVIATGKTKALADKIIAIYSPEEFQLNLAFSKAYMFGSLGSKHGLKGPSMFIDAEVLDAIESLLVGGERNLLVLKRVSETDDEVIDELQTVSVEYRIRRLETEGIMEFEILRSRNGCDFQLLSIEFDAEPVKIAARGLQANLFRVRRFNPIDEPKPFYFNLAIFKK